MAVANALQLEVARGHASAIKGGVSEISIPIIEALPTTEPPEYI